MKRIVGKIIEYLFIKKAKEIAFIIFFICLATFLVMRFIGWLTTRKEVAIFLTVHDIHIHHYFYGIIVLCIVGYVSIVAHQRISKKGLYILAILYGIGLGLLFDEFRLWLDLDPALWQSYDGIIFIVILFLNIVYFKGFWDKFGRLIYRNTLRKIINLRKYKRNTKIRKLI